MNKGNYFNTIIKNRTQKQYRNGTNANIIYGVVINLIYINNIIFMASLIILIIYRRENFIIAQFYHELKGCFSSYISR